MLILSRKLNESIIIDGKIVVKVLRIDKDTVKLGIQAPTELPVHREEIHEAILRSKAQNGGQAPAPKSPPQEQQQRPERSLSESEQKK
jgi:carbon storage regulator